MSLKQSHTALRIERYNRKKYTSHNRDPSQQVNLRDPLFLVFGKMLPLWLEDQLHQMDERYSHLDLKSPTSNKWMMELLKKEKNPSFRYQWMKEKLPCKVGKIRSNVTNNASVSRSP